MRCGASVAAAPRRAYQPYVAGVTILSYAGVAAPARSGPRRTERLASGPGATVAEIRDLLGTTRKYAVPLCEYLDRVGVTRRDGDLRFLPDVAAQSPQS